MLATRILLGPRQNWVIRWFACGIDAWGALCKEVGTQRMFWAYRSKKIKHIRIIRADLSRMPIEMRYELTSVAVPGTFKGELYGQLKLMGKGADHDETLYQLPIATVFERLENQ